MNQITYKIAEQYMSIAHPQGVDCVQQMLSKYAPFIVKAPAQGQDTRLSVEVVDTLGDSKREQELESVKSCVHEAKVYTSGDGYYLSIESGNAFVEGHVTKDWRNLKIVADWTNPRYANVIDRMIMIVFSMAILPLGYLKVHASVIELKGKALIFMGVSGTGKSTHSRLWLQHIPESTLLNDDEPFVRLDESGKVLVYGCPWSGSTECYRPISAEVKAFVHLYQAPYNELKPLSPREALMSLFSSSGFLLNENWSRNQVFDSVSAVLSKVKVYRLDNRPEEEAVKLTRSLIDLE